MDGVRRAFLLGSAAPLLMLSSCYIDLPTESGVDIDELRAALTPDVAALLDADGRFPLQQSAVGEVTEARARALAEAFWRLRDPAAESVLMRMLQRGSPAVRLETARALGRCGGVGSVEPLRRVQGVLAGELGRVAEESIAAIQARARNAAEGQLSVSDAPDAAGRVSVQDARGAVAVARKDKA